EPAVLLEPVDGGLQRCRVEPARTPLGVASRRDEAGVLEDAQVLRHGAHRHLERFRELGDAGIALCEPGEDGSSGGVGESGKGGAERVHETERYHMVPVPIGSLRRPARASRGGGAALWLRWIDGVEALEQAATVGLARARVSDEDVERVAAIGRLLA